MSPLNLGFWKWLLPLIGLVLTIVIIWQSRRTITPTDNLAKVVVSILKRIHKRDLKLKNSTKQQYLVLFGLKEFKEFWDNYAVAHSPETYELIKKEKRGEVLSNDMVQRRSQIDDLYVQLKPVAKQGGWTLDEATKLASYLDKYPKIQNKEYRSIGKRRAADRKWQALFLSLGNLKIEHAQVFKDRELNQMLSEYFDNSKVVVTLNMLIEILESFNLSDLPTAYLESGIDDSTIKIGNHMTNLLGDIHNKIAELERLENKDADK